MARSSGLGLFYEGYEPPSRRNHLTDTPPWPLPSIPWGLSWAYWEMELKDELRATQANLRRYTREREQARSRGLSKQFQQATRKTVKLTLAKVETLKADLVWAREGLSSVAGSLRDQ